MTTANLASLLTAFSHLATVIRTLTVGKNLTLVIGGARSGKSRFSESLALESGLTPVYVATAQARDEEMQTRILHHRQQRDPHWITLEEPLALAELVSRETCPERILLVDCLTLWLSNQLEQENNLEVETTALQIALQNSAGPIVLVSNEVGQGIVPANKLARLFRDEAGRLNQAVATIAKNVYFVMAGLTLPLKIDHTPTGPTIPQ